jgi:ProP effector
MDNPAAPQPPAANPARGLLKLLQESFPAIRDSQPLAIGIDAAILARLPEVDKKTLRAALRTSPASCCGRIAKPGQD